MEDKEAAEDNSFHGWYHCQTTAKYISGIDLTQQHVVLQVHRKPGNTIGLEPGESQCWTICTVETSARVSWHISKHWMWTCCTNCIPMDCCNSWWICAWSTSFTTTGPSTSFTTTGPIEFKNPYSCWDQYLLQAIQSKKLSYLSDSSDTLTLKESDTYYYQVQVAMFCTNRKWCDFVVRMKVDLHMERIKFNETFCLSFLSKLWNFFFNSLLPELTSRFENPSGLIMPNSGTED